MKSERQYDVAVAGAGVAGIAAALECARSGLRTVLIEKTILTGGLATSGLVFVYLPLCDGNGHQVTFGIAEELLHLSICYGPGDVPPGWQKEHSAPEASRYRTLFSPASFILALDEVLTEAGVDVWLDTLICDTVMEGDCAVGVEVENKDGRGVIGADCIIDATGDADVAFRAGAECATGENIMAMWALRASLEKARKASADGSGGPLLDITILGGIPGSPEAVDLEKYDGTDAKTVTRFVLEGRRMLREHFVKSSADRHDDFPVTLPSMAQFRTTRRIVGRETLTDGQNATRFEDSIGLVADWRQPGYVWEIPLRTLIPHKIKGLLAAGRCISSSGDAWEVTRVIPAAALTGQACGAAAVLALERQTTPDRLDASDVQARLRERGVKIHLDEVPGL